MPPEPSHPYEILDVFTDTALQGNPLAVFTEGEQIPSRLMQATARELNLSETIFVLPGDHEAHAQVRIFTPGAELPSPATRFSAQHLSSAAGAGSTRCGCARAPEWFPSA